MVNSRLILYAVSVMWEQVMCDCVIMCMVV